MSWLIVDPKYCTTGGVKVARVEVPYFADEIDYEGIAERAFSGEAFREWRDTVGVLILATPTGYETLHKLMGSQSVDVPEATVREEATRLALERQVVVMRYARDGSA